MKTAISIILLFILHHLPPISAKQCYIVYLGENSAGDGITRVNNANDLKQSHIELLASTTKTNRFLFGRTSKVDSKSDIIYSYTNALNGFAAFLDDDQVQQLRRNPKVRSVFLNKKYNLHTTESWNFLGVENQGDSIWKTAKYGEDVIIANIDTGVWPESKSFSDQGMGPVPERFLGSCQTDGTFKCNKKLIGARFFYEGAEASGIRINISEASPRDFEGHGSHTLSTAGGSFTNLYSDATALGAFYAVKKGIVVVASAGNDGPTPSSVENVAPWIITVGASTMDRAFFSSALLGNKIQLQGTSLSDKSLSARKLYPLINSADAAAPNTSSTDAELCKDQSLDRSKVQGKIVLCLRGENGRLGKGIEAARAGAVGMILANDEINGDALLSDPHFIPATHISYNNGLKVRKYINSTKNPTASISPVKTVYGIKTAPSMASFSSRGPNPIQPGILKPDVTAPGVNVLAAYSGAVSASGGPKDRRIVPYMILSGTSMSCPHISGVAGLIKSVHHDWSPAAIKSAIMTTAKTTNNNRRTISEEGGNSTTPFAYGAGHTRPNNAADPGLVYDMTMDDYLDAICSLGYNSTIMKAFGDYKCPENVNLANINYPSITVPNLNGSTTVTRKVKNVGSPGTYTAQFVPPAGVSGTVEPNKLTFSKRGEEKSFKIVMEPEGSGKPKGYTFGHLIWSDGKHSVRSPVVVQRT
ncbi:Subtilisin-like protease [Euphorbia peplus]|nr:Subtilisin-like protease [Euphorbia peplus]